MLVKPTHYPLCYHGRGRLSGKGSASNGKENGKGLKRAAIFAGLTTRYQPSTLEGSMDLSPEIEPTCSHNCERGHCWPSAYAKVFASEKTICASLVIEIAWRMFYWIVLALRLSDRSSGGKCTMLLVACYPYWVELGKREEVSSTMFREPKQWKPCWTSQERLNGLEVARHEGSLTTQTAIRPGQALARL